MNSDYVQPQFYRFSEDSLILAKLASKLQFSSSSICCLDLGAGCGVIGIETALLRKDITYLELLEYQAEFIPFIEENVKQLPQTNVSIVNKKFSQYKTEKKFDLILGNLPYFDKCSSRSGQNLNTNTCRQFAVDSIVDVVNILERNLKSEGVALLLVHDDQYKYLRCNFKIKELWRKKQVSIFHFSM